MKKRSTRKIKKRAAKPAKKSAKKVVKRKAKVEIKDNAALAAKKNNSSHWATYRDLQKRAEKALAKLRSDVKKKASPSTLLKDKNALLLLLGECNYMARQCMRVASSDEKKNSKKRS